MKQTNSVEVENSNHTTKKFQNEQMMSQHEESEYVILALKDPATGQLKTYVRTVDKYDVIDVKPGDITTISEFSPYPFETFSSLDDGYTLNVERTYLKVKLLDALTSEQIKNMQSSGIKYHQFGRRRVEIIAEFKEPFQYGLRYLEDAGDRLGTWGLTTWAIHNTIQSDAEFKAMKDILKIALKDHKKRGYAFDFSLDACTLPYVPFLRKMNSWYRISVGQYGRVSLPPDVLSQATYLKEADLVFLAEKTYAYLGLFKHPLFTEAFFEKHIKGTENESKFTTYLNRKDIEEIEASGFDVDYLLRIAIQVTMDEGYYGDSEAYYDKKKRDLVSDVNYQPITETYDPYEYHCCSDCDGYEMDWEDEDEEEPYDYETDEQVGVLSAILDKWGDYLGASHIASFSGWSPDIFHRCTQQGIHHPFVLLLCKAYPK